MTEEEKKTIDFLKTFSKTEIDYCKLEKADVLDILNVIDKQQKEIEDMREELQMYVDTNIEENFDTVYMKAVADFKDKIKEILEIEGNVDIEFYLKHLVAENNRLEDIEDDRDCNYVSKDKIRKLIEQFKEIRNQILEDEKICNRTMITLDLKRNDYCEKMLQELLEE